MINCALFRASSFDGGYGSAYLAKMVGQDALFWNIASAKDIDNAMTKGVNYPKGLLAWADEKGIDWCVNQMDQLYDEYREDRYRCSPILRKMNREKKNFF